MIRVIIVLTVETTMSDEYTVGGMSDDGCTLGTSKPLARETVPVPSGTGRCLAPKCVLSRHGAYDAPLLVPFHMPSSNTCRTLSSLTCGRDQSIRNMPHISPIFYITPTWAGRHVRRSTITTLVRYLGRRKKVGRKK